MLSVPEEAGYVPPPTQFRGGVVPRFSSSSANSAAPARRPIYALAARGVGGVLVLALLLIVLVVLLILVGAVLVFLLSTAMGIPIPSLHLGSITG